MLHAFSRTELLIGTEALSKLKNSKVAVFGVGGVGSFAVEALARAGIGKLVIIDDDRVCLTNVNRQLHALRSTVGKVKVEVMKERILAINPQAEVEAIQAFYCADLGDTLVREDYDYIIDAIDTISAKIDLIKRARGKNIPIVCSMGAGNKLDPSRFQIADISETRVCPMAKVVRKELRKLGIEKGVKVVYSTEEPRKPKPLEVDCRSHCICTNKERTCTVRRQIPGSISFVPSVMGLILASVVVNDLIKEFMDD